VLALTAPEENVLDGVERDEVLRIEGLREQVASSDAVVVRIGGSGRELSARHGLSPRQRDVVLAGGLVNWARSA
jgi:aconitate hydratase